MRSIRESLSKLDCAALDIYAQSSKHKEKVRYSMDLIAEGLKQEPATYVAWSAGKDSNVMLHMALLVNPNIEIRHVQWGGETNALGNFDEVIGEWRDRFGLPNLQIINMSRSSINTKSANSGGAMSEYGEYNGYMLGIRAGENKRRGITLKVYGDLYRTVAGKLRICPVARWSENDIGAYTLTHDLPTLDNYHRHGFSERTAARVPTNAIARGLSLTALKRDNPEKFYQLLTKFPEIEEWV